MNASRTLWLAIVMAGLGAWHLGAQPLDEGEIVRTGNWQGMLTLAREAATAGDLDLARRRRAQAWAFALDQAVYDPSVDNSGSNRANGLRGITAVIIDTDPEDPNLQLRQQAQQAIQATNPPLVFSGGPKNEGLWFDPERFDTYLVKQNGGLIQGSVQPRPDAPPPPGQFQRLEGQAFRWWRNHTL
ncbi:MAG: hypothetical protein HY815_13815 [Candidatus Riflebacteria bacterium]|nr:hypothetical protein [Candidatus Riflebacteria bacterium]